MERTQQGATVLVVEDEEDIRELLNFNLRRAGFEVVLAASGEAALSAVSDHIPSLVLLDLMLPGIDGYEVCRRLRKSPQTRHLPIIMLTARADSDDVATGLHTGADDYVAKPFTANILVARIKSVLRRSRPNRDQVDDVLTVASLIIRPGCHEVSANGVPVVLTPTEFQILVMLARRPGWVFSRSQIISKVRGRSYVATSRSVDVQVVSLRRKLGPSGSLIETVRGVGYRLQV